MAKWYDMIQVNDGRRMHILNMIIQNSNSVVAFSIIAVVIVYAVDALMLVLDAFHPTPLGADLYWYYPGNLEAFI